MKYNREDEISVNGVDLYVIDVIIHNGSEYIYAQEIIDDDVTGRYFVYNVTDNMSPVTDESELKTLISLFIENIEKDL